eukprot:gb/GEZN01013464.1/.p1 GENE.gb/GEZN01013464.1/~~gb/GEZN01013464.1/.p1  ORF type:complete len:206 (-),score=24.18 gb/GEZN01013464.1/:294-911(-)
MSVLFFIPNIVGYVRILLSVVAFNYAFNRPSYACWCYAISMLLDMFDGVLARYFNQQSQFGACLDMVTDRLSTAVLYLVLSHMYPHAWGFFSFLLVLDICSHWFQMYSTLLAQESSHKNVTNPLLKFYYTVPYLTIFCFGDQSFLVSLFMIPHFPQPWTTFAKLTFVVFIGKQAMNLVQLVEAVRLLVLLDTQARASKLKKDKNT